MEIVKPIERMEGACAHTRQSLGLCGALLERLEADNHRGKGLAPCRLSHMISFKTSYAGIVYKMRATDKGLFLNYCPFCGGDLKPTSDRLVRYDDEGEVLHGQPEQGEAGRGQVRRRPPQENTLDVEALDEASWPRGHKADAGGEG